MDYVQRHPTPHPPFNITDHIQSLRNNSNIITQVPAVLGQSNNGTLTPSYIRVIISRVERHDLAHSGAKLVREIFVGAVNKLVRLDLTRTRTALRDLQLIVHLHQCIRITDSTLSSCGEGVDSDVQSQGDGADSVTLHGVICVRTTRNAVGVVVVVARKKQTCGVVGGACLRGNEQLFSRQERDHGISHAVQSRDIADSAVYGVGDAGHGVAFLDGVETDGAV